MAYLFSLFAGILLFACYACDTAVGEHAGLLSQIDSLANSHPKEAQSLLQGLQDSLDRLNEEERVYYDLLSLKVKDKMYDRHESDSLIKQITAFYRKQGDRDKLLESYYYMGRVYRDLNDAPEALQAFQKALDVAKDSKNYALISKIYSQMGTLYDYQNVYEAAISMYEKAYQYALKAGRRSILSLKFRDIARAYDGLEKNDSAVVYYQKAVDWARENGPKHRLSGLLTEQGDLYRELGRYDKALECLSESLRDSVDRNMYPTYGVLGHIYLEIGKLDSAEYYLKRCMDSKDIYVQEGVCEYLSLLSEKRADYKEALRFMRLYQQAVDSIQKITASEEIRKMTSLYNYSKRKEEFVSLKKENVRNRIRIYRLFAFSGLLLAVVTGLFYHIKRQKDRSAMQIRALQQEKQEQYERSIRCIEENNEKLREVENLLSQERAENSSLLQVQKELLQVSNERIQLKRTERDLLELELKKSEVYLKFHQAAEPDLKITEADWTALQQLLDRTYNLTNRLLQLYANLSVMELHICYLIKISVKVTDMAKILNRSKSSISSARTRLYKKMTGEEESPNKLDELIADI